MLSHVGLSQAQQPAPLPGQSPIDQAARTATDAQGAQAAAGNGGAPRSPWRLEPSIGLDETWSDNINLLPKGQERSDFVTTISPALRVTRYGSKLTASMFYQPSLLYYANGTNGSSVRNFLNALGNATLVENLLYFDAQASISQQYISPFGAQGSTVNNSGNRAEQRTFGLGPSLRSRFGNDFSYQLGYRFTSSSADNSLFATSRIGQIYGSVSSGTSFRDIGVGLNYSRTDQDFGARGQIITQSIGTTLSYQLQPTFRVRVGGGYDRNEYPTSGQPDLAGPAYNAGFDWVPSQRTNLNVTFGKRYFGPTANVAFRTSSPRYALTATYLRDQTTSAQSGLTVVNSPYFTLADQYLQPFIADPVARAQAAYVLLAQAGLSPFAAANFLSNQLYLQKRAEVSLALFGLRNTVTFNAFRNESQVLSNLQIEFDVFSQANNIRQTGFGVNWSHKLGPRTTANLGVTRTHNVALSGSGDTTSRIIQLSATRQIQKTLSGTLTYRNVNQTGDPGNASTIGGFNTFYARSYRENAVLGSLRLTF